MSVCKACNGSGEQEDELPMGIVDTYTCPYCVGTGLSVESRRIKYAEDATDRSFEKRDQ